MKPKSVLVFLLLLPLLSCANSIGVGYNSKFAKVWRFYEKNEQGNMVPKILIYNTTSKPISFWMKVVLPGSEIKGRALPLLKEYLGLDNDTAIQPVNIPAHGYGIYKTESLLKKVETGFFDAVIINGVGAGIMGVRGNIEIASPRYRYYSDEGINGNGGCLIGTDSLFTTSGGTGHFLLHYDCAEIKQNYPVNEWQIEPSAGKGMEKMTFCKDDGQCYTVDSINHKVKFPINIEKLNSFNIEANYTLNRSDSLSDMEIKLYFCNGCCEGMLLPIFLKNR